MSELFQTQYLLNKHLFSSNKFYWRKKDNSRQTSSQMSITLFERDMGHTPPHISWITSTRPHVSRGICLRSHSHQKKGEKNLNDENYLQKKNVISYFIGRKSLGKSEKSMRAINKINNRVAPNIGCAKRPSCEFFLLVFVVLRNVSIYILKKKNLLVGKVHYMDLINLVRFNLVSNLTWWYKWVENKEKSRLYLGGV